MVAVSLTVNEVNQMVWAIEKIIEPLKLGSPTKRTLTIAVQKLSKALKK